MICQIPSLRLCTNSYFNTEKFLCAKLADNIFDPVMSTRTSLLVDEAIEKAAKAVDIIISQGTDAAMNEYNRKVPVQK